MPSLGPVVINSNNDFWSECPDTTGFRSHTTGETSHNILTFCGFDPEEVPLEERKLPVVNGEMMGSLSSPVVLIHSNAGVTFDLDAIRDDLDLLSVKRFVTSFALTSVDTIYIPYADVTVLIDGDVRYSKQAVTTTDGVLSVELDIDDNDHFVTIAVTDAKDKTNGEYGAVDNDYVYFIEPHLELVGKVK